MIDDAQRAHILTRLQAAKAEETVRILYAAEYGCAQGCVELRGRQRNLLAGTGPSRTDAFANLRQDFAPDQIDAG